MKNKLQISKDPHNKQWSNDTSKFGYQMMVKMGWTEGRGLGAKEDGQTQHVKTKKNLENRGVGCDAKSTDNWLQNTHGFADVLSRLNAAYSAPKAVPAPEADDDTDSSDEDKNPVVPSPKVLPKHLIYRKRHRNKNVTAYKADDLNAILGGTKERAKQSSSSDDDDDDEAEERGPRNPSDALLRPSTQSIDEYFEQRKAALGARSAGNESDADEEERPRFGGLGLGASAAVPFVYVPAPVAGAGDVDADADKKAKKRKKSRPTDEAVAEEEAEAEAPKKRKQSKRRATADGTDVNDAPTMDEEAQETELKKKKKKKKSTEEAEEAPASAEDDADRPQKKKKSSKAGADEVAADEEAATDVERSEKKKKKKRTQRSSE